MADIEGLVRKVTNDLRQVLTKDLDIDDFDIIPTPEAQNKSPVIYIGHKLGLESWCVPHIFCYAYKTIMMMKSSWKRKDIDDFAGLCDIVILLNPDLLTVWNLRKELVKNGVQSLTWELHISKLALTRKPKSSDVFYHRRWILSSLLPSNPDINDLIQHEFSVCKLTAERYPNNYNAWSHRRWVIQKLGPLLIESKQYSMYLTELEFSKNWVSYHVSDHSGVQYLETIIDWFCSCLNQDNPSGKSFNSTELLNSQMTENATLIDSFTGHETLWYYRRYLLSRLLSIYEAAGEYPTNSKCEHSFKRTRLEGTVIDLLVKQENDYLKKFLNGEANPSQLLYAKRHKKWMDQVAGYNKN